MKLTAKNVNNLFSECLSESEGSIEVEGIMMKCFLDVTKHKEDIQSMLSQLPDEFDNKKGGGWSFLNACIDRDGVQWGEHPDMDKLFMLGIAAGIARWQMPRDMWKLLPGGMPYISVDMEQLK